MAESPDPHSHRGTRAIQRMVEFAPSTGSLALWVQHHDVVPGKGQPKQDEPPAIATDGLTVLYGPAFSSLPLMVQTGLVAHEVLHMALRHPQRLQELQQRLGDVDERLFNICADAIVNSALAHLAWLRLPGGSVLLESLLMSTMGGTHTAQAALLEWDVERLYLAMDDRLPPDDSGRASGSMRSTTTAQRSDGPRASRTRAMGAHAIQDLMPGVGWGTAPEQQAGEACAWSERLQRAHASDGAHSMLRGLMADLPSTRTPWEQVLRVQLTRSLSHKLAVSWSRPSRSYLANRGRCGPHRRLPFEPGFMPGKALPRLAVVVDVSGSIDGSLLARFSGEVAGITRRLGTRVIVVIGDQCVRHVEEFEPGRCDLASVKFGGGGGTDFTPLLEEADRHAPDITVVLTDLEGPARFQPRAPVVWAVPPGCSVAVQPFGRKLVLA